MDVILGGIGINKNHAVILNISGEIWIEQIEKNDEGNTFVNGVQISEKTLLKHADRIIFGMNSTFVLYIPD